LEFLEKYSLNSLSSQQILVTSIWEHELLLISMQDKLLQALFLLVSFSLRTDEAQVDVEVLCFCSPCFCGSCWTVL